APAKGALDPQFSSARFGIVDCRLLCLLLFSTRKGIWSKLFQPGTEFARSTDFAGIVSRFRNVDVVQPRVRRRLADRAGSSVAWANCGTLFHPGATVSFGRGNLLCAGLWKSHRAAYNRATVSLFFLAMFRSNHTALVP